MQRPRIHLIAWVGAKPILKVDWQLDVFFIQVSTGDSFYILRTAEVVFIAISQRIKILLK